jgi:hypothetical protein
LVLCTIQSVVLKILQWIDMQTKVNGWILSHEVDCCVIIIVMI